MIRLIGSLFVFSFLAAIEISFISSLPYPLSVFPFVIALSAYLVQRGGFVQVAAWIALLGVILDVFNLNAVPLSTLSYGVAAITVIIVSRAVFTNRSFYGVYGTALATLLTLTVVELSIVLLQWFISEQGLGPNVYLSLTAWRFVTLTAFFFIFYPVAQSIDRFYSGVISRS